MPSGSSDQHGPHRKGSRAQLAHGDSPRAALYPSAAGLPQAPRSGGVLSMNNMSSTGKTSLLILSAVECLVGLFGNGFIVLVLGLSWVRNRRIILVDLIHTCLAISRICFLWTTMCFTYFEVRWEKIRPSVRLLRSSVLLWTGSNGLCTCSTTCLSVFYFLKVGNFSSPAFLWMKRRMHKVLLVIITGTVCHFSLFLIFIETKTNSFVPKWVIMEINSTRNLLDLIIDRLVHYTLINMILIVCFGVSLTSLLLLIVSLWSHCRRMRLQGVLSRDSSTEAHVRAMKTMASSLVFFVMHYLSHLMMILAYSILDSMVAKILAHVLIFLYPSCHPFLLIWWNRKLKQAFLCVLKKLNCVRGQAATHSYNHA